MAAPALPTPADPTAVFGRRALAAVIDLALILVPALLLFTAALEYHTEDTLREAGITGQQLCDEILADDGFCADFTGLDDRVYFADDVPAAPGLYVFGSSFVLLVVLQGLTGWSPGKLLTGVRVVQGDGTVVGLVKALVRWLLWAVDGFPWIIPIVGPILGLTTPGHRRVGDMAARTFVVHRSAVGAPVVVPGLAAATSAVGMPAPVAAAATPGTAGPQWDAARGTYIQWEPAQAAWLQWDDASRTWIRMGGQ